MATSAKIITLGAGEACIAGAQCPDINGDLNWVAGQRLGNPAVKLMAYMLRKIFRGSLDALTVDTDSFHKAINALPADLPKVLIPIHRSYFDFLAAGYLLYARQDLDIPMPYIAAAQEFGEMPLVGSLLGKCGAFFIKRGKGREDVQLTDQIEQLVANRQTFEFFIEGTRSRSREFLAPKRGLLRCLQGTGEQFAIFPIAITYDRVAEENSFHDELSGAGRSKMTLRKLFSWYRAMRRGEVHLGRMHIECAAPILLGPESDIPELANNINGALQRHTACTDYHLAMFCQRHTQLELSTEWLSQQISQRGGRVLASTLDAGAAENQVRPIIERTMQYHWLHFFVDEAMANWPDNPALEDYASRQRYSRNTVSVSATAQPAADKNKISVLLSAIFIPVMENYALVSRVAAGLANNQSIEKDDFFQQCLRVAAEQTVTPDLPVMENALNALVGRGLIQLTAGRHLKVVDMTDQLTQFADQCAVPAVEATCR